MNHKITIICPLFETGSGKVYLAEEVIQNSQIIKYFAFEFRQDYVEKGYFLEGVKILKNLKKSSLFRNYQYMYKSLPQEIFLFDYIEGEFLEKKIMENNKQLKSFDNSEIQTYLKQLLEALYELHSNKIPGRLFSVQNILYSQASKRLILMDFGFGCEINQEKLDILAPPEYLESLIEKKQNDQEFDLKFDSWLVGAFLYNLIKLKPINIIEIQKNTLEKLKYDRKEQYLQYLKQKKTISCYTSRYNINLCYFVESLLTYNKEQRLSFYEIYQHQYIQSLQIEEEKKYLNFYKNISMISDYFQVVSTDQLKGPNENTEIHIQQGNQQKQKSQFTSSVDSQQKQKQKPRIIEISPIKNQKINKKFPDYQSVIMKQPVFQNKKFDNFFLQIQLDYLRCCILAETAEKIITLLPRYKYPFEYVLAYFVKKMHLMILRETDHYLKSDFYKNNYDLDWQAFLKDYSKDLLICPEISYYCDKLMKEIIEMFRDHCYIHLQGNSELSETLKKSLSNSLAQNHNIIFTSEEFLDKGYSEALEILFECVNQIRAQNDKSEELQLFQKQIYICITITSINLENFQQTFREMLPENQQIKPRDIILHLRLSSHN
ncbi:unnamed protein product [Paramecium sonneborni]|uniref:Protein kinase domain-containing protein n=1 Tax=Paramecium sonneborni TaxID=65129 RepID=A0A8S1LQA4_9CILI|nr:unnamed protein product [Paramecium sonneborni]